MKKTALLLCFAFASFCISAAQLPDEYVALDTDSDGFIDVKEVEAVIDGFFTQSNDFSVLFIHDLIDFFFEQP